ncbi:MAG: hypothetical protein ACXU9W_11650 [Thermodesulfobacteriota bacterium]
MIFASFIISRAWKAAIGAFTEGLTPSDELKTGPKYFLSPPLAM